MQLNKETKPNQTFLNTLSFLMLLSLVNPESEIKYNILGGFTLAFFQTFTKNINKLWKSRNIKQSLQNFEIKIVYIKYDNMIST